MVVHLALRRRAAMSMVVAGAIALLLAVPQQGQADLRQAPSALPQMWGMVIDGRTLGMLDRRVLTRLRAAGITLVADRSDLTPRQRGRLARIGARAGLRVFAPEAASDIAGATARCLARKRARAGGRCAARADRPDLGRRLARGRVIDVVVVRARGAREFAGLDEKVRWTRVLGVLDLSVRSFRGERWRRAFRAANRSSLLDLAVRPRGEGKRRALMRILRQVEHRAARDRTPPQQPRRPSTAALDRSSASVSWRALRGVAGYGVYRDGAYERRSRRAKVQFDGLTCAGHLVEVDAIDRTGNRSAKGFVNASPSGCGSRSPGEGGIPEPPPTVFVSPTGSDAGSCTRAAPCASFDRAYREAGPGEVVEVAGGRYPAQTFTADGRTAGPNAIFRPAPGSRPILSGLDFGSGGEPEYGPDFITVRGMETTYKAAEPGAGNQEGVFVGPGSSHIRLERMDVGSVSSYFADHLTVAGGDIGPCEPTSFADAVCNNNHIDVSTNVLFDGVDIHGYRFDESCWSDGADCHWECMYINGGVNVTIARSKFRQCAIFDIFTTISGEDAARMGHRNLRIINNWFAAPWHETASGSSERSTAVSLAWCQNSPHGYKDVLVGFNSFQANATVMVDPNPDCVFDGVRIVGNLMMYESCQSRWTWAYNVFSTTWRTGRCSSTDRILGDRFPYVRGDGAPNMDYHRSAGSSAIDGIVPVSQGCPATDFDGQPRPRTGFCDAGADER